MILNVQIQNLLTFKNINLPLSKGLIVFSGESGTGKSLFMESISMLLGKRADYSMINPKKNNAFISATFQMSFNNLPQNLIHTLSSTLNLEDKELIATRLLEKPNKSKTTLNNIPVTGNYIHDVLGNFVEIQNQFSQNRLLDTKYHLQLLDSFANLHTDVNRLKELWNKWQHYQKELITCQNIAQQQSQNQNHLIQSIQELEELNIQYDEEIQLIDQKKILSNTQKITHAYDQVEKTLFEPTGVMDRIRKLYKIIHQNFETPDLKQSLNNQLDQVSDTLNDFFSQIDSFYQSLQDHPESLETLEDRLYAIRTQTRKHQTVSSNLSDVLLSLKKQLQSIETMDQQIIDLQKETEYIHNQCMDLAQSIQKKRIQVAQLLEKEILKELPPLQLNTMQFKVIIETRPLCSTGLDKVNFLISPHPDFPLSLIQKAASGGELSRFFLAFWAVMAKFNTLETLVFDEVDAGVGGKTASSIGLRLLTLTKSHTSSNKTHTQVICITHSPQIVAYADQHILVSRSKDLSYSTIKSLTKEESVVEMARMLSGSEVTKDAKSVAQHLISSADKFKTKK